MKFIDLLNIGFVKEEIDDEVFYQTNGYYDFFLSYKVSKTLSLCWDRCNGEVYLYDDEEDVELYRTNRLSTVEAMMLLAESISSDIEKTLS